MIGLRSTLQGIVDVLVANRLALSLGIAAASSIVLHDLLPWPDHNPILILVSAEQPTVYALAFRGYELFQFSTPFILCSMVFSLLYVHIYRQNTESTAGLLPPYPEARLRRELSLVLGEVHHALKPEPSATPRWFTVARPLHRYRRGRGHRLGQNPGRHPPRYAAALRLPSERY